MYDRFIFTKSLTIEAYSDKPSRPAEQAKITFLRLLIDRAIEQSEITQDDIRSAIESCGILDHDDLGVYTADEIITRLRDTGNKLVGTLSRKQVQQLRRLRDLCLRVAKGNKALLWDVHNIWRTDPHKTRARA
jgi:hypothetical protein